MMNVLNVSKGIKLIQIVGNVLRVYLNAKTIKIGSVHNVSKAMI